MRTCNLKNKIQFIKNYKQFITALYNVTKYAIKIDHGKCKKCDTIHNQCVKNAVKFFLNKTLK